MNDKSLLNLCISFKYNSGSQDLEWIAQISCINKYENDKESGHYLVIFQEEKFSSSLDCSSVSRLCEGTTSTSYRNGIHHESGYVSWASDYNLSICIRSKRNDKCRTISTSCCITATPSRVLIFSSDRFESYRSLCLWLKWFLNVSPCHVLELKKHQKCHVNEVLNTPFFHASIK